MKLLVALLTGAAAGAAAVALRARAGGPAPAPPPSPGEPGGPGRVAVDVSDAPVDPA